MGESHYNNYSKKGKKLITTSGKNVLKTLSSESLKNIISSILCGGNLRELTENTTKNRLIVSNASLLELYIKIYNHDDEEFFSEIIQQLQKVKKSDNSRLLYLWLLGLTKKGFDNIVRKPENIHLYLENIKETYDTNVNYLNKKFGELEGTIKLNDDEVNIDWNFMCKLFISLGSQTLTVRGSDKSMNGKLFEKLILGSLISMLGFEYYKDVPKHIDISKKIFWLSSTDDNDRETDATILYNQKAIAIDIGFIGKGNPEISLDKATRFRNNKEYGKLKHVLSTIIIVDTIGTNSNIHELAKETDSILIQMNDPLWVQKFSNYVNKMLECDCSLEKLTKQQLHNQIKESISNFKLDKFI